MKSIVKFITFGVLCAGLAVAQRTAPDPASMVKRHVDHLTQTLGLTTAQQGQATALFTNADTANQSVTTSLREARASLAAAIKTNDTGAITTLSNQIGTLTAQSMANTARSEAAFYATLTPEQQAKYTPGVGFGGGGYVGRGGPRGRGGPQQ